MITIRNLSKSYDRKQVLSDINLIFEEGKVYGIVGENGSGKTTLFKCITGMEKPDAGTIDSSVDKLKDHIGFLQTEPFFFSKITGREYIQLLCNARGKVAGDMDIKNVFDLPLNQYAVTYSTGMKKKLALLAILLQENQYFIFDEPFNGVDIQSNILIIDILKRLKEMGKTILISSHIFSTLNDICDEIHLLRNGKFIKKAYKESFGELEEEMKVFLTGNKIDQLGLK